MLAPGDGMPASIASRSRGGSSPRCRAWPCLVDGDGSIHRDYSQPTGLLHPLAARSRSAGSGCWRVAWLCPQWDCRQSTVDQPVCSPQAADEGCSQPSPRREPSVSPQGHGGDSPVAVGAPPSAPCSNGRAASSPTCLHCATP